MCCVGVLRESSHARVTGVGEGEGEGPGQSQDQGMGPRVRARAGVGWWSVMVVIVAGLRAPKAD